MSTVHDAALNSSTSCLPQANGDNVSDHQIFLCDSSLYRPRSPALSFPILWRLVHSSPHDSSVVIIFCILCTCLKKRNLRIRIVVDGGCHCRSPPDCQVAEMIRVILLRHHVLKASSCHLLFKSYNSTVDGDWQHTLFVKLQLGVQLTGGAMVVFFQRGFAGFDHCESELDFYFTGYVGHITAAQICEDINNLYCRVKIRR